MNNIIGSRMAIKLATRELGPRAFIQRQGNSFCVCKVLVRFKGFQYSRCFPKGKNWTEALEKAGVIQYQYQCQQETGTMENCRCAVIPADADPIKNWREPILENMSNPTIKGAIERDADPMDTDAKEPLEVGA
jgi:hypothetical protein